MDSIAPTQALANLSLAFVPQKMLSQRNTEIFISICVDCFTGRRPLKRRMWDKEEIRAVETHMMSFITSCRVPGKRDCDKCLELENIALKNRLVSYKVLH